MGVGSFFREAASGAGSVLDAFGESARQRGQADYKKLIEEIKNNRAYVDQKEKEASELGRRLGLERDAQIVPRAAALHQITETGKEGDLDRSGRALTLQTGQGIRALKAGTEAKKDVITTEYDNQGNLYSRNTKSDIEKMGATFRNQLGLLGGSYRDLIADQGKLSADTQQRFIGSTPLMEQLGANERDGRRDYLNTVLELDERDRPKGLAKFTQQLLPIAGLGASILAAFQ
jgi:hypothetical protein